MRLYCVVSESYSIVYPEVIDRSDGMLVNDVRTLVGRRKRNLGAARKPLEISLSGDGEMFDLELWENDAMFAPGFKIYHRQTLHQAQNDRQLPLEDVYGCHFTGHMRGRSARHASLSICNGLVSCFSMLFHSPFAMDWLVIIFVPFYSPSAMDWLVVLKYFFTLYLQWTG